MALATDLMGLGLPSALALELSDGGSTTAGNLGITAAGNSFATGTAILSDRRLLTCSNGNNTLALALPKITLATNPCGLGDQYQIVNTGTDTVVVYGSTGVIISARGTNTSFALCGAGGTLVLFPTSATATTGTWGGFFG